MSEKLSKPRHLIGPLYDHSEKLLGIAHLLENGLDDGAAEWSDDEIKAQRGLALILKSLSHEAYEYGRVIDEWSVRKEQKHES